MILKTLELKIAQAKAGIWPWLSYSCRVRSTAVGDNNIRTNIYNKCAASTKSTTQLVHISHVKATPCINWSNRWTNRVCTMMIDSGLVGLTFFIHHFHRGMRPSRVLREQKLLKVHLPRVMHHRIYSNIRRILAGIKYQP